MAEHRRVDDILAAIAEREQIHGLVEPRVPPALKYKKERTTKNLPDLRVGCKLVTRHSPDGWSFGDILGYSLGIVLDFYQRRPEMFYTEATAIVQIVRVTSPELLHLIGRLISTNVGDYHGCPLFVPEQAQLSDYKWVETPNAPRPLAY